MSSARGRPFTGPPRTPRTPAAVVTRAAPARCVASRHGSSSVGEALRSQGPCDFSIGDRISNLHGHCRRRDNFDPELHVRTRASNVLRSPPRWNPTHAPALQQPWLPRSSPRNTVDVLLLRRAVKVFGWDHRHMWAWMPPRPSPDSYKPKRKERYHTLRTLFPSHIFHVWHPLWKNENQKDSACGVRAPASCKSRRAHDALFASDRWKERKPSRPQQQSFL